MTGGAANDRYGTDDGWPDERGCVSLVTAFWQQVHGDLKHTTNRDCHKTVKWVLASPDFGWWCAMAGARADEVRRMLTETYPRSFALYGK